LRRKKGIYDTQLPPIIAAEKGNLCPVFSDYLTG